MRLDVNLHIIAHEHAARLERGVPGEAEVAPVDLGLGAEADALAAPRVAAAPLERRVERDLARRAVDRQVADHLEAAALGGAGALDPLAAEAHGRVLGDVEEL